MTWLETWRETVESFLREVRDPDEVAPAAPENDPVVASIAAARAELAGLERERSAAVQRMDVERQAAASCDRRRLQAERIGDVETARIAGSFERRHAARAAVLERKCAVLDDEIRLARASVAELLDYARGTMREP